MLVLLVLIGKHYTEAKGLQSALIGLLAPKDGAGWGYTGICFGLVLPTEFLLSGTQYIVSLTEDQILRVPDNELLAIESQMNCFLRS